MCTLPHAGPAGRASRTHARARTPCEWSENGVVWHVLSVKDELVAPGALGECMSCDPEFGALDVE